MDRRFVHGRISDKDTSRCDTVAVRGGHGSGEMLTDYLITAPGFGAGHGPVSYLASSPPQ